MHDKTPIRSLIEHTELLDIRTVEVSGVGLDETSELAQNLNEINFSLILGNEGFRATQGELRVRTKASLTYSTFSEDESGGEEFASIKVVFELILSLDEEIDPNSITGEEIVNLDQENLTFILFPYVRSALQSLASELRLPPPILPFMRR